MASQLSPLLEELGGPIKGHLKSQEADVSQFLDKHQISGDYRAKMIDWMVEVLTTFKCSDQCFFIAVSLLDRFFKCSLKPLEAGELHLTGMVCMFIASKFEDVVPLLMRTMFNKIGHKKFPERDIKLKEQQILQTL